MFAASHSPTRPTSTGKPASKVTSKKSDSKVKAAAKPRAAPKTKATKSDGRPTWKDIIKECIAVNKGDARQGVSRNTIKRYAEEAYKIDMTGLNLSQLNRAITSGTEGGIFLLPKGPSGKIKLASKTKPLTSASKENSKPSSKAKTITTKKVAAPPPVKKTAAAPKKALAGKAKSTTTKKMTAPSKRGAAKKAITKSKPAAEAKTAATRKAPVKKAVSAKKT